MPPFVSDRTWRFDAAVADVWAALNRIDEYPRWWPWLETFAADGLHAGARASFRVRPPLPYRLNVALDVRRVEPERLVAVAIGGDVAGAGRLELAPAGTGATDVRLVWALTLERPVLRAAERVARPAMVWGHDRVVELGVRQFRQRALGHHPLA